MLTFVIDNREHIKDKIKEVIPEAIFDNLLLGDYLFKIESKPFLLIERKTICDYAMSIKDGRNKEQKKRLLSNKEVNHILYLVEGDLTQDNSSFKYNKVSKHTIMSSIINTILRDKINVLHTSSSEETIFVLESIYKKLEKQNDSFIENKTTYTDDIINTVKMKKSDNITPEISLQMMLNCIPGVSNKVSSRILSKCGTLKNLIEIISSLDTTEARIKYIQDIKTSDEDKGRKISKSAAQNIIIYTGYS